MKLIKSRVFRKRRSWWLDSLDKHLRVLVKDVRSLKETENFTFQISGFGQKCNVHFKNLHTFERVESRRRRRCCRKSNQPGKTCYSSLNIPYKEFLIYIPSLVRLRSSQGVANIKHLSFRHEGHCTKFVLFALTLFSHCLDAPVNSVRVIVGVTLILNISFSMIKRK